MNDSSDSPATMALPQLGRYQLQRLLGEGGMGAVYLAYDAQLDRAVAVKILPTHAVNDPAAVARFQREARALAKLTHAGIVQAYDSGEEQGKHFLVMEHVEGNNLARLLKEQGSLSPGRAADFIYQAALALHHAHEKGLIHRDIKPGNLLITPNGQVKILDLGLARFLQDQIVDAAQTQEGTGMGTPDYASPEQFKDAHHVDHRADIYSLGCTLYHMIAGRVPFPTSSFSEKYKAHCHREPSPLEELCPDIPGGLAVVVQKMMAKRPADRFQSIQAVADALAPYVAGSSVSFQALRNTGSWKVAPVTEREFPRSQRLPWLLSGVLSVAVLILVLGFVAPGWFLSEDEPRDEDQLVAVHDDTERKPTPVEEKKDGTPKDKGKKDDAPKEEVKKDAPQKDDGKKPPEVPAKPMPFDDPNVLTVTQKKVDGGKFQSIGEAVKAIKAGQVIRILDSAVYNEHVMLDDPEQHSGITIEGLKRATVQLPATARNGIVVHGVPGVRLTGLKVTQEAGDRAPVAGQSLIKITAHCPGTRVDDLHLLPTLYTAAILIDGVPLREEDEPLVVARCTIEGNAKADGILVVGPDNPMTNPTRRIIVRENRITGAVRGIHLQQTVSKVHVVGNLVSNGTHHGIGVEDVNAGCRDILIANNTMMDCPYGFRVWDAMPYEKYTPGQVSLYGNLILESTKADMISMLADAEEKFQGIGPSEPLLQNWRFLANHRTITEAGLNKPIALAPDDREVAAVRFVSRQFAEADYLRPKKTASLESAGAGQKDPSLPLYVGAMPPEGVEPWDWERTWLVPPGGSELITVSKDPDHKAKFDSITAAVKAAKPWATIRVLDGSAYLEQIVLDDPDKHKGLCLEATAEAVLNLNRTTPQVVSIIGVPHVRVRGFRFRTTQTVQSNAFIKVTSRCPGVILEQNDLFSETDANGIVLSNVNNAVDDPPLVVRDCTLRVGDADTLSIAGPREAGKQLEASSGIAVRNNRFLGAGFRGIMLQGSLQRVHLCGNLIRNCGNAAIQVQDLGEGSKSLLLANNTLLDSATGFRVWSNHESWEPSPGQVEVCNQLILNASDADLMAVKMTAPSPELSTQVAKRWNLHHNLRDFSGKESSSMFPLSLEEIRVATVPFLSRDLSEANAYRPRSGFTLAAKGAGLGDSALPIYIGALPPEGLNAWDWDITWRARMKSSPKKPE